MLKKKISEHFNVETARDLWKWKIADYDGISYEDIPEIIQSYFTNRPVRLISSTMILDDERNLFILMIRIKARSSLGLILRSSSTDAHVAFALNSSSGLPNTMEDFADATLWHSLCSSISPSETAHGQTIATEQLVQEFQVGYWLHECHFVLKLQFMHSDSTQLTVFDTNATHCLLEQLEKSTLLRNELIGAWQNRRWTVKFCKGVGWGGGLLKIAGGTLMKLT